MVSVLLVSVKISTTPYLPYIRGHCHGVVSVGGETFNGISQHIISFGASKDFILVHTVQLKPIMKAHSSGTMVSSGKVMW